MLGVTCRIRPGRRSGLRDKHRRASERRRARVLRDGEAVVEAEDVLTDEQVRLELRVIEEIEALIEEYGVDRAYVAEALSE
jgi:hypothetical protein